MNERFAKIAKTAFHREITKKIKWLSELVWAENAEMYLKGLNDIILAARTFGATKTVELGVFEIKELAKQIGPMRTLEMKEEVHDLLVGFLESKGLEKEIFHPNIEAGAPAS